MSDNWKMQDEDASMPIGTGSENTQGEIAFPAEKKPRVQGMTALLTVVFIGGLGLIYSVGLLHKPRSADASQTQTDEQINTALAQLASKGGKGERLSTMFADTDKLVRMFYDYPGKISVPAEDLPGNPFEHLGPKAGIVDPIIPIIPKPNDNAAAEERARKLAESFGKLKLQTVMVSANMSMAQINDQLVQVGTKVGEFTVDSIESKRVVVRNGDNKFELLLNQPKKE